MYNGVFCFLEVLDHKHYVDLWSYFIVPINLNFLFISIFLWWLNITKKKRFGNKMANTDFTLPGILSALIYILIF